MGAGTADGTGDLARGALREGVIPDSVTSARAAVGGHLPRLHRGCAGRYHTRLARSEWAGTQHDPPAFAPAAAMLRHPAPRPDTPNTETLMPSVKVRENEPFEFALRRFKRTCEKAGVLAEVRKREFYEKPTQERKRKAAAAVKRQARRSSRDVTKRQRLY